MRTSHIAIVLGLAVLAEAGTAGFEMAGVAATNDVLVVCFKRPVILAPAATTPSGS